MKTVKNVSRFVIDAMVGSTMPYSVKIDSIQLVNPFKTIEEAIEYIHNIVNGVSMAEVMVSGTSMVPEESGFDDVVIMKMPANVIDLYAHIQNDQLYINYRGMPLQKKISKIRDAVDEIKKFAPKVKETGGSISIKVDCGPVISKSMSLTEFEVFAEYLAK